VTSNNKGTLDVAMGLGLCAALHWLFYFSIWMIALFLVKQNVIGEQFALVSLLITLGGIAIVQFAYVVPTFFYLKRQGKVGVAKGLVIGACVTFLLNSSCWGWFLIAKPRIIGG